MNAFQFYLSGNWAHFKKPETNNNPLTHDFITKTALIGLLGAITGKERKEMRALFPQLSEDLLYGVEIVNPVKKESWGFTMRKAVNLFEKAPKYLELLKNPKFKICLALSNPRSKEIFDNAKVNITRQYTYYTPVLGLHNCPADIKFIYETEMSEKQTGEFNTSGFVSTNHRLNIEQTRMFRLGFDNIPTYQNDDFWNLPDKYVRVVYPSEQSVITVAGEYYKTENGEHWWLI